MAPASGNSATRGTGSSALLARLAAHQDRVGDKPRPIGEVVASLNAQQQKLQGLERRLRHLQQSPSPRRPASCLAPALPPEPSREPAAAMGISAHGRSEEGELAVFLQNVASRIDALDRQLQNIADTDKVGKSALPQPSGWDADARRTLLRSAVPTRSVRRAVSADGLGGRHVWARRGWPPQFSERVESDEILAQEEAETQLANPFSQLAAAAALAAEDALGSQHRGRSAERLHVHLWASPPPQVDAGAPSPLRHLQSRFGEFNSASGGLEVPVQNALGNPHASVSAASAAAASAAAAAAQAAAAASPWASDGHGSIQSAFQNAEEQYWQQGGPTPAFGSSIASERVSALAHSFSGPAIEPRLYGPQSQSTGRPPLMHMDHPAHSLQVDPSRGLPIYDQADAEAFAELGRKAPQPRDALISHYTSGDMASVAESGAGGAAASNGLPAAAFNGGYSTLRADQAALPQAQSASHNWGRMPAGPSGRARQAAVHQAGPDTRSLQTAHPEQSHRPASSWSSRPPTYYEGGSEASLSARGHVAGPLGGMVLNGGDVGGAFRPLDRPDNFPADVFWAK